MFSTMRPDDGFRTFGNMELIVMILVPFPLGLLVRNRTAAYLAYIAIHGFVFTFQTANLVMEWANGSTEAFGSFPDFNNGDVWGYGIVNLVIYGVGLGLVTLGYRIRTKRNTRRNSVSTSNQTSKGRPMRQRIHRPLAALAAAMSLIAACGTDDEPATTDSEVVNDQNSVSTIAETVVTTSSVQTEAATTLSMPASDFAWKFDGNGTPAAGGIELEFVGAHALSEEAVSFDGHTGHAITSTPGPLDTTQAFTVTAWVNYAAQSEIAAAVSQLADKPAAFQLGIGETSQWWFMMKTADQTGLDNAAWAEGTATSPSNRWVHLAGVHDPDEGAIRLFVDGQLAAETAFTTPVAANGPMTIGRAQFDATPGNFWPGAIAEVGIYQSPPSRRARSPSCTPPRLRHASPPPQPEPDPSTYADGILNGTWDYVLGPAEAELADVLVSDFGLAGAAEISVRFGFDDHECWQSFVIDGELMLEPGGVPAGDGGTFVIEGDEIIFTNQWGQGISQWHLDGEQLTMTVLASCNTEHTPPLCIDDRERDHRVGPVRDPRQRAHLHQERRRPSILTRPGSTPISRRCLEAARPTRSRTE